MDELERPIARRLGDEVARQGLVLEYLDCPIWHGKAPAQMRCEGYLNGVVATVVVRLTKTTNTVTFDAELQDGLLATRNLVRRLRAEGYRDIDCGATPAYPTVVGEELVCSVGDGSSAYVVAEVLDESGTVEIRDY